MCNRAKGYLKTKCKLCECREARERESRKPASQRRLEYRSGHYWRMYGATVERYEQMLQTQHGRCAICGANDPGRKGNASFCIDHDHDTGIIRGLLCNDCNLGIGRFRDDHALLLKAAEYLKSHLGTKEAKI